MDNIKQDNATVVYCPTEDMVTDFFTKSVQRSLFWKFKNTIMNLKDKTLSEKQECVEESKSEKLDFFVESSQPMDLETRSYVNIVKASSSQQAHFLEQAG